MKELIRHLLTNNYDAIVSRSLLNCHCIGLHSVMLLESPGQTIRLYVADRGNHLYKNAPEFYQEGMSIGFHPHHCNLTLHCVKGQFINWSIREPFPFEMDRSFSLREYHYHSQIVEGKQGFELVNPSKVLVSDGRRRVTEGEAIYMDAGELHTVICDPFSISAWLVYEGKEDPNYTGKCYSTSHLENISTEGMYQRPDGHTVRDLLKKAGLLD